MAEMIRKGDNLNKTLKQGEKQNELYYVLSVLLLTAAIFCMFKFEQVWILVVWMIWFFVTNPQKKKKKWKGYIQGGIKGENETEKILLELPNEYKIFSDVILYSEGRENQLDHIVIGPNGVFVVETKYWTGEIYESKDSQKLIQYKNGQKKEYYHPSRQVETHVKRLESVLKSGFSKTKVQGLVYFSNKNAVVKASDIICPIIKEREELLSFLRNTRIDKLSEKEIEKVIKKIKKQSK